MIERLIYLSRSRNVRMNPLAMVGRLVLPVCFGLTISPLHGQPSAIEDPKFWMPDGPVNAILVTNDTVYLGGDFSYVGPFTGPAALFDQATGQLQAAPPHIAGTVKAVLPDGSGGWFIGGSFTGIGNAAITNVARLKPDLSVDTGWDARVVGTAVNALALDSGRLYVGGQYTRIGGQLQSSLAAVNASDGTLVGWNPQFSGSAVNAMQVSGGLLYVGGNFYSLGSSNRQHLAAISTSTALANAWDPAPDQQVFTLAVSGNTIYVGGQFNTSIGTKAKQRLAAVDATTGVANTTWSPNPNGIVRALAVGASAVYVGGDFTTISVTSRRGFAAIAPSPGIATARALDLQLQSVGTVSLVRSLVLQGNSLYVGGSFTNALGALHRLVVGLDLTTVLPVPVPLATDFNGAAGAAFGANALASAGGMVLVGGDFLSFGGVARQRAAALSRTTGVALPWAPAFDAPVNCLAYGSNQVYVGGSFTNVNTTNSSPTLVGGLAAVDSITGDPASFTFRGTNGSGAVAINALVLSSNALYAGGAFTVVANQSRRFLAALDPATGSPLSDFDAKLGGGYAGINSLVLAGASLYAAGDFTTVNAVSLPRLVAVSPSDGSARSWTPAPNQAVTALAASQDTLYVGGNFSTISEISLKNFAAFSLADNSLIPVDAQLPTYAAGVTAIGATPTTLYAAGWFTAIGGEFRQNLGCLAWYAVAYDWNPSPDLPPTVITLTDDLAFIGGTFRSLGQSPTNRVKGFLAAFQRAPQITSSFLADATDLRIVTTTGDRADAVLQATTDAAHPTWTNVATNSTPGFAWTIDVPTASPSHRFFRMVAR